MARPLDGCRNSESQNHVLKRRAALNRTQWHFLGSGASTVADLARRKLCCNSICGLCT